MKNSDIKILLVDDEPDILEFLKYNLQKEGFITYIAHTGAKSVEIAIKEVPNLVLLDVMMPEMDGIETCEEMRRHSVLDNTIIAFFTARGEDYSQVAGLEAGGDDYITKPIKPKVLVSKIHSLLRRQGFASAAEETMQKIEINGLIIDRERYNVSIHGTELTLPKKEFELLILLASKPDKVFTREEIYSTVWGNKIVVGDRTIDVHIRKLREKLGDDLIQTIKGVGYKFVD